MVYNIGLHKQNVRIEKSEFVAKTKFLYDVSEIQTRGFL